MKRHWKIIIAAILLLPMAISLGLTLLRIGGQRDVDAYKKLLIGQGEKLEFAALIPPPVPPEKNGADLIKQAVGMLLPEEHNYTNTVPMMSMVTPEKAIVCFEQPDVRDYYFTNTWPNIQAVIAYDRPATELLRQAANYPAFDFHLDYTPDFVIEADPTPSPLDAPAKCADTLAREAMGDLCRRNAASAATNICAMLALANGMQDERLSRAEDVRESIAHSAAEASWQLLQSPQVNDLELAKLQKHWQRLEFVQATENAFAMSRAQIIFTIQKMRESRAYFDHIVGEVRRWNFSGDWNDKWENVRDHVERNYLESMWQVSWSYPDELRTLQIYQLTLETIRSARTNGYFNPAFSNLNAQLSALAASQGSGDMNTVRWMFSGDNESSGYEVARLMMAEAQRQIVITAIALKRFELKHGKYPPDLNSLVPEFVSAIPRDPVDGQPLRYRLNSDGTFLLYSIALNGRDDGGNPSLEAGLSGSQFYWLNRHNLDWVWPQPATPAEIQFFYDHRPK